MHLKNYLKKCKLKHTTVKVFYDYFQEILQIDKILKKA